MDLITTYLKTTVAYNNRFFAGADPEEIQAQEELCELKLPEDYRNFLMQSNGFEGFSNQCYLRLIPVGFIYENTLDYCSESYPWAVYLGTNGGGEMIVLDKRTEPSQFGLLPYLGSDEDLIHLGETFESFLKCIYNDEVFGDG